MIVQQLFPGLLGLMYYFLFMIFILFIFHYLYYYHKGKTDRSYLELYEKLDGFARPAMMMFILFLVFTYVAQNIEGFGAVLVKGGILS